MVDEYSQVTPEDVRLALNDISEEELATGTIEQKIEDGEYYAENKGLSGYKKTKFVRSFAALKSFLVSNTYNQVDFGEIEVRRDWERILEELEKELEEVGSEPLVVDDSYMFDERPSEKLREEELVEEA